MKFSENEMLYEALVEQEKAQTIINDIINDLEEYKDATYMWHDRSRNVTKLHSILDYVCSVKDALEVLNELPIDKEPAESALAETPDIAQIRDLIIQELNKIDSYNALDLIRKIAINLQK